MAAILEFRDSTGAGNLGNTGTGGTQTNTTALPANQARTGWQIQNQAGAVLYVNLGPGCSATVYSFILKACTGTLDGTGGSYAMMDGNVYRGVVTVYASGTPSYSVLEL